MKKIILSILLILVISTSSVAGTLSGDIYLGFATKYLLRGQHVHDGVVLQPGADLNFNNLSIGFWGSAHLAEVGQYKKGMGEADLLVSYSDSFPFLEELSLTGGFTYITVPIFFHGAGDNTLEAFFSIAYDWIVVPEITLIYDVASGIGSGTGLYLDTKISYGYEFEKTGIAISSGINLGANFGQWGAEPSLSVLGIDVGTSWGTKGFFISANFFTQIALNDQVSVYFPNRTRMYNHDWAISISTGYEFEFTSKKDKEESEE